MCVCVCVCVYVWLTKSVKIAPYKKEGIVLFIFILCQNSLHWPLAFIPYLKEQSAIVHVIEHNWLMRFIRDIENTSKTWSMK